MPSAQRPFMDKAHPALYKQLNALALGIKEEQDKLGIPRSLIELLNVRVSQLNGCTACLSIHVPAAIKAGNPELKVTLLPAWRDSSEFSAAERAALGLAESLTVRSGTSSVLLGSDKEPVFEAISEHFSTAQISLLEWSIITINTFNRLSIASGHPPRRPTSSSQS